MDVRVDEVPVASALYVQGLKAMVSVATAGENVCPVRAGVEGDNRLGIAERMSLPCTCRG